MTRISTITHLALLACCCWLPAQPAWGQAATEANLPLPLATRQDTFMIPFRVSVPVTGPSAGVEVALYVSEDMGKSWKRHSAVKPNEPGFRFRAPRDGEYWFAVRTHDASGAALPAGTLRPEMRVIVDTVPPELQIVCEATDEGAITVQMRIHDPQLKADTFKLEYHADDSGEAWETVAVDPIPHGEGTPRPWYGQVTLWPKSTAASYSIRAEIQDLAGNPAVSQVQVALHPPAALVARPGGAEQEPAAGSPGDAPVPTPWPADEAGVSPTAAFRSPRAAARQVADRGPSFEQGPDLAPAGARAVASGGDGWRPVIRQPQRYPVANGTNGPGTVDGRPPVAGRFVNSYAVEPDLPKPKATTDAAPPPPSGPRYSPAPPTAGDWLPPGVRPRMVNSTRFELDYDVESVGPWGVRRVELWGTRDGGQTWSAYGVDTDNQSPIGATVEGEGIYGFRVLVQSGSGLVESPPQSGDLPEVWIGVDLTPPQCQILNVDQGAGERAGQLIIHWEADDLTPADRPISLSFAAQPDGPWMTIASGLRNTGRYVWQLDGRTPDALYLRLEARDEAGNVAVCQPSEPYQVAPLRPRGRIRDVRSLGDVP
jgi:hypothetical protein